MFSTTNIVIALFALVFWVAIWVIPFRHRIYNWWDQRFGR